MKERGKYFFSGEWFVFSESLWSNLNKTGTKSFLVEEKAKILAKLAKNDQGSFLLMFNLTLVAGSDFEFFHHQYKKNFP